MEPSGLGLHHHRRDMVRDHIMQLVRDARPLGQDDLPFQHFGVAPAHRGLRAKPGTEDPQRRQHRSEGEGVGYRERGVNPNQGRDKQDVAG
ncbi:hypothetical protein [Glutamicibacter sp. NPDC087583]|uniref:hypothetical protein n=1 Tax=Glutamicibacter sp. NPDC087583 TaxID=3363995 RepID=UPI00382347AF